MVPISEAMLEPILPASTSDIMVGENSRMMESRATMPTADIGIKGFTRLYTV